jgi:hypothetical protein
VLQSQYHLVTNHLTDVNVEVIAIVFVVPAPCGSGKTHQGIKHAVDRAFNHGEAVLYVLPTVEQIRKTIANEMEKHNLQPLYFDIHNERNGGKSATDAIVDHLRDNLIEGNGQVLFITQQALSWIKHWPNRDRWHVVIDESIQITKSTELRFARTHLHRHFTDLLHLEPVHGTSQRQKDDGVYARVTALDEDIMEKIATGRTNDDFDIGSVRDLARLLSNGVTDDTEGFGRCWRTWVDADAFKKAANGEIDVLEFQSVMDPKVLQGFGSVMVLGANLMSTLMLRLWAREGIKFKLHEDIACQLRDLTHKCGERVTIWYGINSAWSKHRREELIDGVRLVERIVGSALEVVGDRDFVWMANASISDTIITEKLAHRDSRRVERLPNMPHGRNDYAWADVILFLSALLPTPAHFRFLREVFAISDEEVRRAFYHEIVYQGVMRTSLRDPKSDRPVTVIVPDSGAAEYLRNLLPGAQVRRLNMGAEVKEVHLRRKHANNAEKQRAYRARKKELVHAYLRLPQRQIQGRDVRVLEEDERSTAWHAPFYRGQR